MKKEKKIELKWLPEKCLSEFFSLLFQERLDLPVSGLRFLNIEPTAM
jgi:hypothetical protein